MKALPPPQVIDSHQALRSLADTLRPAAQIAVDTESNSLYAYHERVCLIQISTRERDYLVDPLALDGLDPLDDIFASPGIEKVFHAAEYDIMCLRRDFGFRFENLFDTMLAARILGWEKYGLGSILEELFGVEVDKRHQRANWGYRPLSPDLIRYAQIDTHYLLPLRDTLYERLAAGGHLEEAAELFREACEVEWHQAPFDPEDFWKLKGADALPADSLATLRELYVYREGEAQRRNRPVFKIMSDQTLVTLAEQLPRSMRDLAAIHGISKLQVRRFGKDILDAVRRGLRRKPPKRTFHRRRRMDEYVVMRYEALHEWRKARAAQRGVMADVIMTKDALWEIAQVAPRTLEQLTAIWHLGPWRRATYGEDILRILAEVDSHNSQEE
jgi:ribonuclease D